MSSITQKSRQLKVHSHLGEDYLLLQEISGSESISEIYNYMVVLLSHDDMIDGNQIVGKRITIEYFSEDGRSRFIDGFVNTFSYQGQTSQDIDGDRLSTYHAQIVPWLWFLDNRKDCRIFQELSTPEIIQQVFSELGYSDYKLSLTENYQPREYCVQYRETDLNFVSRLMEEEGIYFYFKHQNGKHVMHICDAVSGYYTLDDGQVQMGRGQGQFRQITSWKHVYQFRPGKVAQKDFNFKTPQDPLKTEKTGTINYDHSQKLEIFEYPGRYEENSDGNRFTKIRMEELETRHNVVEGQGGYLSFSPGGTFQVEEHDRASEIGKSYLIIQVSLYLSNNLGFGGGGTDFNCLFQCIPSETIFRPERRSFKPVVEGLQTAIVTTDGQEIVVDEHGRVKVQFHWDRYGKKDFQSSCWIRVSQVHAGKNWGMIDIPRKDEEVIVSFIDGDPDRPIITGRVYNGDNPVPFELKGGANNVKNKTRRGNMTKSYEATGYNELSMDDTAGKEQIRVHAQYDMNSTVLHDQTLDVGNDLTENVGNDRTRTVGKNEEITIGENQTITIGKNVAQTVGESSSETIAKNKTINVGESLTIVCGSSKLVMKKDGSILLEGKDIVLKASGNISAKAGGNITLKGSMIGQN